MDWVGRRVDVVGVGVPLRHWIVDVGLAVVIGVGAYALGSQAGFTKGFEFGKNSNWLLLSVSTD